MPTCSYEYDTAKIFLTRWVVSLGPTQPLRTKRRDTKRKSRVVRDCVQPTITTIYPESAVAGEFKRSRTVSGLFRSHAVMPGGVDATESNEELYSRDLRLGAVDARELSTEVRPVALTSAIQDAILGTDGILASSQGESSSHLTGASNARRRYSLVLMPPTSGQTRPQVEQNNLADMAVSTPAAIVTAVQSEHEVLNRAPSANDCHGDQHPSESPTCSDVAHRERSKVISWLLALQRLTSPPKPLSSDCMREMPWRKKLHFYLTQPESSVLGWRLHHGLMVLLFINIIIMASQTLDGPRFEGSDPVFTYLPSEDSYMAAEVFFTFVYVLELVVRSVAEPSLLQHWKNAHTWIGLLALLPWFLITGSNDSSASTRSRVHTHDKIDMLRILRVVRLMSFCRIYVGYQVMQKTVVNSFPALKITVRSFL